MSDASLTKEQLADAALAESAKDAVRRVIGKPHPRDYCATVIETLNGPRWQIESNHLRECYFRDLAAYWRREATKGNAT